MREKKIKISDNIFIAGATGMVGSSIKRKLIEFGYGLSQNNAKIFSPSRQELDLLNFKAVNIWMKENKPKVVILAAAKVGGIFANSSYPAEFILQNLKIQTNVIEASFLNGVKRFLFLGSSCIYPKYAEQPIEEESLLTKELESSNQWYAIAKIAGLKLCEALRLQNQFDAISLMPTNLYGPNDNYHPENSHVMPALIKKFLDARANNNSEITCWGTGSVLREFLYVDDLAEAAIFCLERWDPSAKNAPLDKFGNKLNHLNVGTGKDISIKELATKIAKMTNYKGEIIWDNSKPDGTPRKLLNIDKISSLGWRAKTSLDEGIKKTIKSLNL